MPNKTFAKMIQFHDGAYISRKGTGIANNHPAIKIFLRENFFSSLTINKFESAFVVPNAIINESKTVVPSIPNASFPKAGSIDLSSPIILPTKALINTNNQNCFTFSLIPAYYVNALTLDKYLIQIKHIKGQNQKLRLIKKLLQIPKEQFLMFR
jgi:hypothetical protein